MKADTDKPTMIRVRPGTRRFLDHLSLLKGWKVAEVAERAAIALAESEGIPFPPVDQSKPKRRKSA